MANQGIFSGGVRIRSLNGYLIAVNGEVFATTNTGGTTNAFFYRAKTTITSGDPGSGHLIWNNATQISATQLNISHLTDTPVEDIDLFLSAITSGNKLVVQDRNDSQNYQSWTVSGAPTQVGSLYWTIPVSLIESQGTGTTGFANNHDLLFAIITGGTGGGGITTNAVTFNNSGSGAASGTSFNGATPVTVSYNTIGAQQASAKLSSLAGLTYVSGTPFVKMTGANTFALDTNTYLTGNQTITISGDASGSGATSIALTLATVNSNIGTFNNVTVNAKGLVTAASNVAYLTANQTITLSGNVTGSGSTSITTTIANNVVTNAMLAQIATARIRGRVTAGTGNVEDLTGTQATTLLDTFTSALKGLAPASGGGTTNFLRADGTWAAPPGGGGTPAGSNTQIQYNNSGAFGASAKLTWNETTRVLNVGDGSADTAIEVYSRNISNGWAGRFLGDYTTGQFYIQHRNNSATWQTCLFFNGNTNGATYMVDKAYVVGLGILMVNTATDNGVDKLQVNGSVISTSGYKITSGTSSQYLKADGTTQQITAGTAAPTGGNDNDIYFQYDVSILTGSGTTNYIPKFTSASAIGNSQIFDDGTNVGIGTTSPAAKLDVVGVIRNNDKITANANNINGTATIGTYFNNSSIAQFVNNQRVANSTEYGFMQGSDGTNYIGGSKNVFEYGNVGIGTTSPNSRLHTTGSLSVNDIIYLQRASSSTFIPIANFWNGTGSPMAGTKGDILAIGQSGGDAVIIATNNTERMRITSGGNTLIGTTTDNGTDKLQVSGNITATQYSATVQTLTDGATITFDASNGSNAVVTLGGNRTLAFSNTRTGAYYTLRVIQDGTGSRTLAMPGTVKVIGGGGGVVNLTTTANAVDIISFYFDGTTYWASFGQNYT